MEEGQPHPAIASGWIHVAVAAVHPFRDGNGRAARVCASLALYRGEFKRPELTSLEEWWGRHLDDYYAAFECLGGEFDPSADVTSFLVAPPGSPATRSEIARQPGEGRAPDLDRTQGNRGRREPRPTRRECSVGCLLRTRCNSRVLPLPYRCRLRNRCEGSCGGGARRPLEARGSTPWPPLPANRASVRTRGGSSCCGGLGPARYGPGSDRRRTKPSPDAYGGPRLGEG